MRGRLLNIIGFVFLNILLWAPAGSCLTSADIEKLLRTQKLIGAGVQIRSLIQGNEVHISTVPDKNAKDTTERYKIEAVLMAKTIMAADKFIQTVFVRFYDRTSVEQYSEVTVPQFNVKAFGAGSVTEDELLNSLKLERGVDLSARATADGAVPPPLPATAPSIEVVDGPLKNERMKLGLRIHSLKSKGVGVKPFLEQFSSLEELAKTGTSATVAAKMEALTESVTDQEKVLADRLRADKFRSSSSSSLKIAAVSSTINGATVPSPEGSGIEGIAEKLLAGYVRDHIADPKLKPVDGPLPLARARIAWLIDSRKVKVTGSIMAMWVECQSLAAASNATELRSKIAYMAHAMGVPDPVTEHAWYIRLWKQEHEREEQEHGRRGYHDRD